MCENPRACTWLDGYVAWVDLHSVSCAGSDLCGAILKSVQTVATIIQPSQACWHPHRVHMMLGTQRRSDGSQDHFFAVE
jgi:hypothetical protein